MSINNKDKIIEVAFLLSLENGFDRVSMKQIQEESELSAGSIYYYFEDKNEILVAMFNKYFLGTVPLVKERLRNVKGTFFDKLTSILTHDINSFNQIEINSNDMSNFTMKYGDYLSLSMSIYHQYPEIRPLFIELYNGYNDFFCELIQEAIENNEVRDDVDIKILAMHVSSSFRGCLDLWMNQLEFSIEELVEANLTMLVEATKK